VSGEQGDETLRAVAARYARFGGAADRRVGARRTRHSNPASKIVSDATPQMAEKIKEKHRSN
jgi:hypothetical protein